MPQTNRRQFLIKSAQMAGASACAAALWLPLVAMQRQAQAYALPPPGAVAEADFEALCIKCGLCVEACERLNVEVRKRKTITSGATVDPLSRPPVVLKLASLGDPAPMGTPFFIARTGPCFMCEDIPCARVCPTGALDRNLPEIADARMGTAVIDAEHCLSWRGLRCEVCYRVCPVRDKAITLSYEENHKTGKHAIFRPIVNSEYCTGCGICEQKCITEESSIRILRGQYVQGKLGAHYQQQPADGAQVILQEVGKDTAIPDALKPSDKPQAAPGMDYFNRGGGTP